jgi:peptidoglycan hydrolase-like protein with peptidoglycan-binding domain
MVAVPEGGLGAPIRARMGSMLQRQVGNARLNRPLGATVRAKLTVGTPNDEYEQEADRVADQVMRTAQPLASAETVATPPANTPAPRQMNEEGQAGAQTVLVHRQMRGDGPEVSPEVETHINSSRGGGRPLPEPVRASMEAKFGQDFGGVRVHNGPGAAEAARKVNAQAFTTGQDLHFAEGQYQPDTPQGQRLLAHELTHTVQQGAPSAARAASQLQRTIGDGHDLRSNRFKGNVQLEAAYDNESRIHIGANGLHVTIIQQALVDAGFPLPVHGVSGQFMNETRNAVRAFQGSKGLTGPAVDGIVGQTTMTLLDQHFLGHAPERAIASDPARPVLEGTRGLTAPERAGVTAAITTEVRTPSGALPTFHRTIAGIPNPYEVRIRNRLNQAITSLHSSQVTSRPPRVAGNLMTSADVDRLAQRAKAVTDAVYGRYRAGPAMAFGLNIFDQFLERQAEISASTANADRAANWRVLKLLNGDEGIGDIDREHGAVQTRAAEWSLIAGVTGFPNTPPGVLNYTTHPPHVTTGIVGTRRAELLDIHQNWPASAGGGQIFLQMYLGGTDAANRNIMYKTFGTIIHEYIHTLEHPNHVTYRRGLPEQRGGFVLREGMTDYLAKVVWDNLNFNAALRATIEDRFGDPLHPTGHPIPPPPRYSEWANAERAAGIVGIRNAMAAFFLGRTDLIGGP